MTPLEFAVLIAGEEMGSERSNMTMFLSPQGFVWPQSSAQKARPFCHWDEQKSARLVERANLKKVLRGQAQNSIPWRTVELESLLWEFLKEQK